MEHIREGMEAAGRALTAHSRNLVRRAIEAAASPWAKTGGLLREELEKIQAYELRRVLETFDQDLSYLARERATEAALYGGLEAETRETMLKRWLAHPINREKPLFYFRDPNLKTLEQTLQEQADSMSNHPVDLSGLFRGW